MEVAVGIAVRVLGRVARIVGSVVLVSSLWLWGLAFAYLARFVPTLSYPGGVVGGITGTSPGRWGHTLIVVVAFMTCGLWAAPRRAGDSRPHWVLVWTGVGAPLACLAGGLAGLSAWVMDPDECTMVLCWPAPLELLGIVTPTVIAGLAAVVLAFVAIPGDRLLRACAPSALWFALTVVQCAIWEPVAIPLLVWLVP